MARCVGVSPSSRVLRPFLANSFRLAGPTSGMRQCSSVIELLPSDSRHEPDSSPGNRELGPNRGCFLRSWEKRTLSLRSWVLAFCACLILLCSSVAIAQTTPDVEQGVKPYGSYHGGDIDSVNLSNGNLILHVPLLSYPQRGGQLPFTFYIQYNNKGYRAVPNDPQHPNEGRHWVLQWSGVVVAPDHAVSFQYQKFQGILSGNTYTVYLCTITTVDGSQHQLTDCQDSSARTIDTTGIVGGMVGSTPSMVDRKGISQTLNGATTNITDTNGNYISVTSSGWTDTMGRSIPGSSTATGPPVFNGPYPGLTTTNHNGCQGSVAAARKWTVPVPGGVTESYKFCYQNYSYQTAFGVTGVSEASGTVPVLTQILLPNGTSWLFSYNSYLDLTYVGIPTKGSVSYNWINPLPGIVTGRAVSSRTVNDGIGSYVTNYSYDTVCASWNGNCQTTVTDALQNDTVHVFTNGYETEARWYQNSGTGRTLLKTLDTTYSFTQNPFDLYTGATTWINVVPLTRTTTWPDGEVTETTYSYDSGGSFSFYDVTSDNPDQPTTYPIVFGNVLHQFDYDYGSPSWGNLLRTTNTNYLWQGPNPSYLTNNMLDLVSSTQVLDGYGNPLTNTVYGYDESPLQASNVGEQKTTGLSFPGNRTSVQRWLNTGTFNCPNGVTGGSNSFVVSPTAYYDTGTASSTSDPCGNAITYVYDPAYYGAYPTTVTNALGQQTLYGYDLNTGVITSVTDPNKLITSYSYDAMARLAGITRPDGGSDTITRQETAFPFTSTVTSTINSTQSKMSTNLFDGVGRVTQTQLTSDPQGTVYSDTTYDGLGHVATVSNPYRGGSDATSSPGTTLYSYDGLGRKSKVIYPDNSLLTTLYCGSWTLVIDPSRKWRRSRSDALGHLTEVDEPNVVGAMPDPSGCPGQNDPVWVTSYTNDALGNLTQAVQNGSHTRTFSYDSLSRLITSYNPESKTITYAYNPDGPLLNKTEGREITTSYTYDALHRPTTITYSNGDATITYNYDETNCVGLTKCQNIGHRTSMVDAAGSETWAYQIDKTHNRSIHEDQRTNLAPPECGAHICVQKQGWTSVTKTATYYLDLAGNITQMIYPTGRTVNYTYDSANRPSSATDASGGVTYATGWQTPPAGTACLTSAVCYTPQGSVYGMSLGQTGSFAGLNIFENFNNRLQPNEIRAFSATVTAMDINYSFVDQSSGGNAGHVNGITNNLIQDRSQIFTYDQLNRISTAGTQTTTGTYCWGYTYTIDPWGNLTAQTPSPSYTGCSEYAPSAVSADGNNQLSALNYDGSGNTLTDGVNTYTWDAESQLTNTGGSYGTYYNYDGDGRRTSKLHSKMYWYGSGGEILAETNASGTR